MSDHFHILIGKNICWDNLLTFNTFVSIHLHGFLMYCGY